MQLVEESAESGARLALRLLILRCEECVLGWLLPPATGNGF